MKSRLLIISMCILLMLGAVYVISTSLYQERKAPTIATKATNAATSIPIERGVFTRSAEALNYQNMPESKKRLAVHYENRAYPGAPPMVPHPLISEKGIGGKTCLQCHENGGYTEQFKAFAPVTPHPEWLNCKQCHLPKTTNLTFKGTNWEKMPAPAIHQVAMPGAPPMIPHDLQLRENCLSCHAGPAAPKEIRVSHPERVNCRQCHLPVTENTLFSKPVPQSDNFERPEKEIGYKSNLIQSSEVTEIADWLDKGR